MSHIYATACNSERQMDQIDVYIYVHLKVNAFPTLFFLSKACLKEVWTERKGDPAIAQSKKKKKSKKKVKSGEHNQNKEKKLKKKKRSLLDKKSDEQKMEEVGHASDEEIQKSVSLPQERTEL